ncbi:hypothetical protein [Aquabacterium humicola]|uniref:hypothetical protein n=1 Tax=Aquabacterium humicola TaxID=3237377 RepID=UPI002542B661|nr:hypothetical protein [Rubrivivax pictus]
MSAILLIGGLLYLRLVRLEGSRSSAPVQTAFVPVPIEVAMTPTPTMSVQVRLPNGVVIDLRGCDSTQACQMIEALGSLRCSVSTKG